jgi:predicted Rossmann fold nucleotide-binding protein DprA/Smf involved in DNA uptake
VRSPASVGCNQLIADAGPVGMARDVTDVLVALHLEPGSRRTTVERRPTPTPRGTAVLDALDWQPATLEQLVLRTARPLGEVAAALAQLDHDGWIAERGGWYERRARRGA